MADSCFGSSFYMLTGFHGLHVFIGTTLLIGTLYRLRLGLLTNTSHTLFIVSV
jgi:cytochrome c oxidase subunit 3